MSRATGRRRAPFLALITGLYLVWSLAPVLIAVLFSFNDGRSRTNWQGFSLRWYAGDPLRSVFHDPALQQAVVHTFRLGIIVTLKVLIALVSADAPMISPVIATAPRSCPWFRDTTKSARIGTITVAPRLRRNARA